MDDIEPFLDGVKDRLQTQRSDFSWILERTGCMRVCPEGRISMTVSSSKNLNDIRLTLSKEATIESVVSEVLSFFRPLRGGE